MRLSYPRRRMGTLDRMKALGLSAERKGALERAHGELYGQMKLRVDPHDAAVVGDSTWDMLA